MTARPWPESTAPTAAQLLEYLRTGPTDDDDRALIYLDGLIHDADVAHRCRITDHDYGMRQLTAAQADATRWRILRDYHRDPTNPTDSVADKAIALLNEDDTP